MLPVVDRVVMIVGSDVGEIAEKINETISDLEDQGMAVRDVRVCYAPPRILATLLAQQAPRPITWNPAAELKEPRRA